MTKYITIQRHRCRRCGCRWYPRPQTTKRADGKPIRCGECRSPYWDKRRKQPVERLKLTRILRDITPAPAGN
jgi:hypothetical protein